MVRCSVRWLLLVCGGCLVAVCCECGVAGAATPGPAWAVKSVALPTNFSSEDTPSCESEKVCDAYVVTVTNVGTASSSAPLVVRDRLPEGIVGVGKANAKVHFPGTSENDKFSCEVESAVVTCTYGAEEEQPPIVPEGVLEVRVEVEVEPSAASTVVNRVEVEGGGAPVVVSGEPATVANSVTVGGVAPVAAFGIQDFEVGVLGAENTPDVVAGDHPATITTTLDWHSLLNAANPGGAQILAYPAAAEPEAEVVDLPEGLVGNPLVLERCPASAVQGTHLHPEKCPTDSRVGVVAVESQGGNTELIDLFNVPPEAGYPAEFGFEFDGTVVMLRPRLLPSAGGYVLSVSVPYLPRSQTIKVTGARVTFFGDPGERAGGNQEAFLTNPDDCESGPLRARLEMDAWVDPGDWQVREAPVYEASSSQGVSGCAGLRFEPSIQVAPETSEEDTPSGYEVDVRVPQAPSIPGVLATPDLKDAVVSLPEGVSLAAGAANGLVGCQASGPEGIDLGSADELDAENRVQEGEEMGVDGLVHPAPGHCPAASQVGEVEVFTPVLAAPLKGHVFVAAPSCGGEGQPGCSEASATNGELYGLYLEVAGSGVIVKLRGDVSANPVTGQLTTRFSENPQFPFSELRLRLNGGPRAPLANPQSCGAATTTSDMTPWSTPFTPDATPSSVFAVTGCAASTPFTPTFNAGALSVRAASSSILTTTFSRGDGEQDLAGVSVSLPAGLVGFISEVPLCEEPLAEEGGCSEASLVGSTTVAVGAGADPFWVSGKVYLTGPYNGAPFGLSIVVPAKAGPFNLGNVVVRAAININPSTTAVTVTSGALPQIKDGVPFRVRTVNVQVNRPGFILNPSNCEQQSVTGTIAGAQGAIASVSSPFAVEGCSALKFAPSLTASTQGKASKLDGASLVIKVSYPVGGEANIRSVKTDLPVQLPSRLTTLQKACVATVFEADPADCPAESVVGTAKASSPILPVELTGPAYLVSHGNEKFPNLVIVLQGDGVRVDLVGDTDIKKGITSSTFHSIPDDPVSSFELYLPEGKYSILGTYIPVSANYNLCGQKLVMPTEITGQNGAVIKQNTKIAITGCKKAKVKKKKTKKTARAKKSSLAASSSRGR